jgi:hypothetical protein
MSGVIAGVLLIILSVVAAGFAVYLMATTTRPVATAFLMCFPLMIFAFVCVTAGGVFLTA